MGSTKLWLPSRKSVASHRGALSMVLSGHVRLGRFTGGNFLYFLEGSLSLQHTVRNKFCCDTPPSGSKGPPMSMVVACLHLHRHFDKKVAAGTPGSKNLSFEKQIVKE